MQVKDKTTGRFILNLKERTCLFCGIQFKPRIEVEKFCSQACYWKESKNKKQDPEIVRKRAISNTGRKTGKFINCEICQKERYVYPSRIGKKDRFCSSS